MPLETRPKVVNPFETEKGGKRIGIYQSFGNGDGVKKDR
jgi:hypothetical protein